MQWDKDKVYMILFGQLRALFWLYPNEKEKIDFYINHERRGVIKRIEKCFSAVQNKYYNDHGMIIFSPLHTCQYTLFLYYLANTLFYETGDRSLCDRIYGLSKIVSGMDMYYEINMPNIFFFDHPVGSVIGRAKYRDYFSFSQGCTVGQNKGIYPEFGEKVIMLSNSKVIGKSKIGDNVIISANTYVKDYDIPNDSIVFGSSPNLMIKRNKQEIIKDIFRI